MSLEIFANHLTAADELTALLGSPSDLVIKKQLNALDRHMRAFIAESPFMLLATVDADGRCDVSPRGDAPPVAQVVDERHLMFADWPGNRRVDSLGNILQTGQAALLFLLPGHGETLRVNGTACVFRDLAKREQLAREGKTPALGVGMEVRECYLQCAKALIRSKLWEHLPPRAAPSSCSFGEILIEQTGNHDESASSLDERIEESYKNRLY